jgi:FKBP-type peptidyl-prolyl cis-trans isomerase 2
MTKFKLVKYAIVVFMIIAVYSGNAIKIKELASKTTFVIKSFTSNSQAKTSEEQKSQLQASDENALPFKVSTEQNDSLVSNVTVNVINKILDNPHGRAIFEDVVNKMVTNYHGTLGDDVINKEYIIKDITKGSGKTAMCGDIVTIAYTTQLSSDKILKDISKQEIKQITIGKHSLNRGLENGIIGMLENGQRKIVFSDTHLLKENQEKNKKDFFVADVILKKIIKNNIQNNNWGVFVDKESFSVIGPKILCGDSIDAYYTIRTSNGKKLYDSKENKKKINFEIGSQKTPAKISQGLLGLVKNKSKISVVLTKQELQYQDKNGNKLAAKTTPTELVILDIDTRE